MSSVMNRNLSFLKDLETKFRGTVFKLQGHPLDQQDTERIANAYTLWTAVVADLIGVEDLTLSAHKGVFIQWQRALSSSDIDDIFSLCSGLVKCLRLWDPYQGTHTKSSFKHWLASHGITYHDPLLGPIWRLVDEFACTFDFMKVNTALNFISRLTLVNVSWIEESALQSYIQLEEEMKGWTYDASLLEELSVQMHEVAQYYKFGRPSHSSGATAQVERKEGLQSKLLIAPSWANRQLCLKYDLPYDSTFNDPLMWARYPSGGTTSRVLFVPKGINKKRTISPEPTFSVYLQHGIEDGLKGIFRSHPEFGYWPEDQGHNRDLAFLGGRSRQFGTIDLSEASDRVTWTLVRQTLRGTNLLWDLSRCRSTHAALPNGQTIRLEKFAPMGSACCFPIESMVFSSIVRMAQRRVGRRTPFAVYGDDIVCHESCFSMVEEILDQLHMKVNQDKTYEPYDPFKESCGIEVFCGKVVDPFRISRFYDVVRARHHDPVMLNSLTDFSNRSYTYGLRLTREYIVNELLQDFPAAEFGDVGSSKVWSDHATNWHLRCRRDRNTQRVSLRVQTLSSYCEPGPDDIRYTVLLQRYAETKRTSLLYPEDRIDVSIGPTVQRLEYRWT